ncbi:MAG: hypothetical protein AAB733_01325 [Patescibacteria group bacterium]
MEPTPRRTGIGTEIHKLPLRDSHEDLKIKLAIEVALMMRSEFKGEENTVQDAWTKKYANAFRRLWNREDYREMVYAEWEANREYILDKIRADLEKEVNPPADNARPATW